MGPIKREKGFKRGSCWKNKLGVGWPIYLVEWKLVYYQKASGIQGL